MTRPAGRRNADYTATRETLLAAMAERLHAVDAARVSLRELAAAAGVSLPTLRHYFGDRDQLLAEVIAFHRRNGEAHVRALADGGDGLPLARSVREALAILHGGFTLGAMTRFLTVGLGTPSDSAVAHACVVELLEPAVASLAARLARHQARGEIDASVDLRTAARMLIGTIALLTMHQHDLGGAGTHPVDLDAELDRQTALFVRAVQAHEHVG